MKVKAHDKIHQQALIINCGSMGFPLRIDNFNTLYYTFTEQRNEYPKEEVNNPEIKKQEFQKEKDS